MTNKPMTKFFEYSLKDENTFFIGTVQQQQTGDRQNRYAGFGNRCNFLY